MLGFLRYHYFHFSQVQLWEFLFRYCSFGANSCTHVGAFQQEDCLSAYISAVGVIYVDFYLGGRNTSVINKMHGRSACVGGWKGTIIYRNEKTPHFKRALATCPPKNFYGDKR
jgi:hypothetical protein